MVFFLAGQAGNCVLAQDAYVKVYGHRYSTVFNASLVNSSENFVFAGWYDVESLFTAEFYFVETDRNGEVLFSRTYGEFVDTTVNKSNGSGNEGFDIFQTMDGGYLLSGERHEVRGGTSDVALVRLDANKNLLWSKTYGDTLNEYGMKVLETPDGDILVTGFAESYGAGQRDAYLLKLNSQGDTLWTKTYGGPLLDQANDMLLLNYGEIMLIGNTFSFGNNSSDIYLLRLDSQGNIIWAYTYGGTGNDFGRSAAIDDNGNLYILGDTESFGSAQSDILMMQLDMSGNILNAVTAGGEGLEIGKQIQLTPSGQLIIGGTTTSFGAQNKDIQLIAMDTDGNIQSSRLYGGPFEDDLSSITILDDDQLLLAGTTFSYGEGNADALVIKTNMGTSTLCPHTDVDFFSIPVTPERTTISTTISNGTKVRRASTLSGKTATIETTVCEGNVSTTHYDKLTTISLYPNPTNGVLWLDIPDTLTGNLTNLQLTITDLTGKIVHAQTGYDKQAGLDLYSLNSGIYYLAVTYPSGRVALPFIVSP